MSHVVVVGAGSIGLHAAYHLRGRGHGVTIVDPGASGRDGASFGNAGFVVPSHFVPLAAPGVVWQGIRWMADPSSPFYVKPRPSPALAAWGMRFWASANARHVRTSAPALLALNLRSRELWPHLVRDLDRDVSFSTNGLLMLCRTDVGLEREAHVAALAHELGLRAEVLDAAQVRALEPDADTAAVGAIRFPDDAHMDPRALIEALQYLLERAGTLFRFGVRATRIVRRNGHVSGVAVAPTDGGDPEEVLQADHVVLAAGSWTAPLAREVGLRLLLQPGKGYGLTTRAPGPILRSATILVEAHAAASTIGDRFRIGGTMELAGFDSRRNQARIDGIKRASRQYFPSLQPEQLDNAEVWHGLRPLSPDGLPYLGRAPAAPNVIVATGHAMMGFSAGPATGHAVADLVDGRPPIVDLDRFRPERHT